MFTAYEIKKKIAVGGMAEVFLSRATREDGIEQMLVVKRLLPEYSRNTHFVASLFNEARLAASLKHPHIVQIFDFGRIQESFFLSLEYVDGYDLATISRHLRRSSTAVPLAAACSIFIDICMGLDFAHQANDADGKWLGLVHRDVSPANIIVSREGTAKLLDFGIAKATQTESQHTQVGVVKGKFAYLAPEQVLGKGVDKACDVYSASLTFYELLTHINPFKAETSYHSLQKVMNETVQPANTLHPEVTPELAAVIAKGMARDATERYQSCSELARAVQHVCREGGIQYSHSCVRKLIKEWSEALDKLDDRTAAAAVKSDIAGKTLFLTQSSSLHRLTASALASAEDITNMCDVFDAVPDDRPPSEPGARRPGSSPGAHPRTGGTAIGRPRTDLGSRPRTELGVSADNPIPIAEVDEVIEISDGPSFKQKLLYAGLGLALAGSLVLWFTSARVSLPPTPPPQVANTITGVTITTTPPGAQVLLSMGDSGRLVMLSGRTPMTIDEMEADWNYSFEVKLNDYQPWRGSFNLHPNELRSLHADLRPLKN